MTYLSRSQTNGSSRKKFTVSAWIKLGVSDNIQKIFDGYDGGGTYFYFAVETVGNGHVLIVKNESNGTNCNIKTSRTFRDPAAWYNFVLQVDTTQGTAANRVKIYVNGVQETSFSASTYPNQNRDFWVSVPSGATYYVGGRTAETIYSMSHFHYIDGSIIAVGQFGSVDSTTGEWKLNTSPTVSSYGTNGFAILKDGTTITDQSPNSNNYSSNGTALTKTEDCPDNNFTTMNPVDATRGAGNIVYANGNTTVSISNSERNASRSSLAFTAGKFYAECKVISVGGDVRIGVMGIDGTVAQPVNFANNTNPYSFEYGYSYRTNGQKENNNSASSYGASYGNGDIIGVAFNATNNSITFYKNGASQGVAFSSLNSNYWVFYCTLLSSASVSWNFGNGYFGGTAVSSAGTNASSNGIFEYNVPSGYTALSTKGLNL